MQCVLRSGVHDVHADNGVAADAVVVFGNGAQVAQAVAHVEGNGQGHDQDEGSGSDTDEKAGEDYFAIEDEAEGMGPLQLSRCTFDWNDGCSIS